MHKWKPEKRITNTFITFPLLVDINNMGGKFRVSETRTIPVIIVMNPAKTG